MIGNDTKFKLYDAKLHTNGRRMADWSETCLFESVDGLLRTSWGILGLPWAPGASCGRRGLWAILEHPGTSWELPGASLVSGGLLVASWGFLGLRGSPGGTWGRLGLRGSPGASLVSGGQTVRCKNA